MFEPSTVYPRVKEDKNPHLTPVVLHFYFKLCQAMFFFFNGSLMEPFSPAVEFWVIPRNFCLIIYEY